MLLTGTQNDRPQLEHSDVIFGRPFREFSVYLIVISLRSQIIIVNGLKKANRTIDDTAVFRLLRGGCFGACCEVRKARENREIVSRGDVLSLGSVYSEHKSRLNV